MKVLVVTESYWPNGDGGAQFERRLVLGLVKLGHIVTVWAPGPKFKSYDENDEGSLVHRERGVTLFANRKYKVSLFPLLKARSVIRRDRPDIIHIHNCGWMGLFAMLWARVYRIPVIATNHFMPENLTLNLRLPSLFDPALERLTWSFLVWFHNRAGYVTSPTPTAVKLLVDRGLHVPSEAISNGIDTDVFKPAPRSRQIIERYHVPSGKPIMMYIGRLDGEKRVDIIIEALAELADTKAHLVLAGFGNDMKRLQSLAKSKGLASRVTFTGYLDEADKPALYNLADVFVIASPAELQSIVTMEAMASGLPIVAVDVAALSELCRPGVNGLLFERDSAHDCAQKTRDIIENKANQKEFGAMSRNIVQAEHSTAHMITAFETAYKRTLATHGRAS